MKTIVKPDALDDTQIDLVNKIITVGYIEETSENKLILSSNC
ncbi:MAG: hypothetical protein H6Q14_2581 [Bacteroidetes bacterium]|jgi:hypothetical protein|nr:hypothetical protein [Bacteroidota bacterium]